MQSALCRGCCHNCYHYMHWIVPGLGFKDPNPKEQLGRLSQEKSNLGGLADPRLARLTPGWGDRQGS